MEEKNQVKKGAEKASSVIEQYKAQTEKKDDIHFEHYDWTYGDSSGGCCC